MVKNTKGGKNHKKYGRKFTQSGGDRTVRESREEGELYSCVSKVLGNNMCHILTQDSKTMLLHIRNKFRGRGKRDNKIELGTFILAGIREFETLKADKLPNCDLLEVYNDNEIEKIKKMNNDINWNVFKTITDLKNTSSEINDDDIGVVFENRTIEQTIAENEIQENTENTKNTIMIDGDEIDIDDI